MTALLHERVSAAARRWPAATAIVMRDRRVTYHQLDDASTRLARTLREAGCRDGDRVGLLLPKSIDAIVAMLGVLKARGVYVPIDVQNPAPRAARIVDACRPRAILATTSAAPLLTELRAVSPAAAEARVGWLGAPPTAEALATGFTQDDVDAQSAAPLSISGEPEARAHILFTSGSTGLPKGVVINHASVATFLDWALPHFGYQPGERVSGHAPLHFDLSTFDIYGALSAGAELHLVPPELNLLPGKLARFIRESELVQWFSVPSVMNYMARMDAVRPGDFPALRRVLWCGEVLPTPALIHWMERLPHANFTNLYGPTEATIASSWYRIPSVPSDPAANIPIGRPCAGERLFVLGPDKRPLPPGEIEAALGAIDAPQEYAVVAVDRDSFEGATVCCAYAAKPGRELPAAELRTLLSARLPAYMLPTRWAALDGLPKNGNGKIDRRRLQDEVFAT